MPREMKFATYLTIAGFVWYGWARWETFTGRTGRSVYAEAIGLATTAVAAALFWWAVVTTRRRRLTLAFSDDAPVFMISTGPYRWVRHPFYASYLAWWCAVALECGGVLPWAMPAIMVFLYARAARMEEAKFASSPFSRDYAAYVSKTGMMMPVRPWWLHRTD
jgi:protein-S-isoprenylcysteine O-methyltransferase Ste14